MSLRDILGLYGPNRAKWDNETYERITRSGVKWVVWRLDADPEAPTILASMGVSVIAQDTDGFNSGGHLDPAGEAAEAYALLSERCPPGVPFVFDNEPNLDPKRATRWHAEQWTRYARAYMAYWRWLDPGGHFPLVLPALAVGPDRNGALWHDIGRENLAEADGVGLHAYWQNPVQIDEPDFGDPEMLVGEFAGDKPLYGLEYANTLPRLTHADTIGQYESFLLGLTDNVRCACLFGLDLTDDWRRFHITEPVLDWLANLR